MYVEKVIFLQILNEWKKRFLTLNVFKQKINNSVVSKQSNINWKIAVL